MRIVNKLTDILAAMVEDSGSYLQSYQYNSKPLANVSLDRNKPSPTALLLVVTDWNLIPNGTNVKESAEVNVSFLISQRPADKNMTAVDENIIDRAAAIAVDFISRVMAEKTLRIEDDTLKVKSVYDRSDSTRSGVNLTLTITEKQGVCADAYYPQDQDQIGTTVSDG